MSKTIFSKKFQSELDVEQALALHTNCPIEKAVELLLDIPDNLRQVIYQDSVCPSCGSEGAILVNESKKTKSQTSLRQAHFRFANTKGESAHKPNCELDPQNKEKSPLGETIDFQAAKTAETRMVRTLVCTGIDLKLFSQLDIRNMRQWFFDIKSENSYILSTDPNIFDYLLNLVRSYSGSLSPFLHGMAELPGFDWKKAAMDEFARQNLDLTDRARCLLIASNMDSAKKMIARYTGSEVFDASVLEPFYTQTEILCRVIEKNTNMRPHVEHTRKFRPRSSVLLAFSALLLFVSEWDINVSIAKLAMILRSPPPSDLLLGNVIGLNPFANYGVWKIIGDVDSLISKYQPDRDYDNAIKNIEINLRATHEIWREQNPSLIIKY
ncbi:hypothetical protein [Pseudomonas viridiflava]|uniref:hypothetical protein n=1 Tax=Pseudomonas viridiflava TaxID=33069 RepID=UPI000F032874|nr:hypothetical protein [Pseudomonas viridiflava]MEE4097412.1 hypothetical protein [Pseudomonas viridiflava]